MTKINILLVDHHILVREGLRALLAGQSDIKIVGEAGDGPETLKLVKELKPDVVLLDISMPGLTGTEPLRLIKEVSPGTEILILTMHQAQPDIREALTAGAMGYMLKTGSITDLIMAIQMVHQKKYFLSPEISSNLIDNFLNKKAGDPLLSKHDRLTRREQQVFKLMAESNTTIEIAELLNISPKTVAKHRGNLMEKLQLKNTVALIHYALKIGIIDPENNPE